jgi:hypothetical protein
MAEPMAWPPRDEQALAAALAELAEMVAFPPTPPIAQAVGVRLRELPPQRRQAGPFDWPGWRLGRSVAFAIIALLVLAGAAVAFGIVVGGLRITFAPGTPPPIPSGVVQSRAFGEEVSLDQARLRVPFHVVLPSLAGIGPPDHVYLQPVPSGGTATLVWGPRSGYPGDTNGVGLVITEFQATVEPTAWEKLIYNGTSVTSTAVGDQQAFWISGGDHGFFYRDANGQRVETSLRVVGQTLVWQQGGLVLRVEGAPSLEAATAVGESLR